MDQHGAGPPSLPSSQIHAGNSGMLNAFQKDLLPLIQELAETNQQIRNILSHSCVPLRKPSPNERNTKGHKSGRTGDTFDSPDDGYSELEFECNPTVTRKKGTSNRHAMSTIEDQDDSSSDERIEPKSTMRTTKGKANRNARNLDNGLVVKFTDNKSTQENKNEFSSGGTYPEEADQIPVEVSPPENHGPSGRAYDPDLEEEIKRQRDTPMKAPWYFCKPGYISDLFPERHEFKQDISVLATRCEKVRHSLRTTVLPYWGHLATLIPLIEERLLCCTGDPALRKAACWDRRPRGTFLDHKWDAKDPNKKSFEFFVKDCEPEKLMQILIEVLAAVEERGQSITGVQGQFGQAWNELCLRDVLKRCYNSGTLLEPTGPEVHLKYGEHIFYILAAIELLNTRFKSSRAKQPSELCPDKNGNPPDEVLQTPLITIINRVLGESRIPSVSTSKARRRPPPGLPVSCQPCQIHCPKVFVSDMESGALGRFIPSDLEILKLKQIGSFNVDWTEYMEEHLSFDKASTTVYIYWFFSHIGKNNCWHLYCRKEECYEHHNQEGSAAPTEKVGRSRSSTSPPNFAEEVLQSYRWLFPTQSRSKALEQLLSLPVPWWLLSPKAQNMRLPWHAAGRSRKTEDLLSRKESHRLGFLPKMGPFARGADVASGARKRPTLRGLYKKDPQNLFPIFGRFFKNHSPLMLPEDCKELLHYLDEEDDDDSHGENEDGSIRAITNSVPYEEYPILRTRIELLTKVMEGQQPQGLFALWRDKRQSISWYTFWAAIIFGAAAFVLALAGFGLSIAQTWASFKALENA